jgi:hypothetical protein
MERPILFGGLMPFIKKGFPLQAPQNRVNPDSQVPNQATDISNYFLSYTYPIAGVFAGDFWRMEGGVEPQIQHLPLLADDSANPNQPTVIGWPGSLDIYYDNRFLNPDLVDFEANGYRFITFGTGNPSVNGNPFKTSYPTALPYRPLMGDGILPCWEPQNCFRRKDFPIIELKTLFVGSNALSRRPTEIDFSDPAFYFHYDHVNPQPELIYDQLAAQGITTIMYSNAQDSAPQLGAFIAIDNIVDASVFQICFPLAQDVESANWYWDVYGGVFGIGPPYAGYPGYVYGNTIDPTSFIGGRILQIHFATQSLFESHVSVYSFPPATGNPFPLSTPGTRRFFQSYLAEYPGPNPGDPPTPVIYWFMTEVLDGFFQQQLAQIQSALKSVADFQLVIVADSGWLNNPYRAFNDLGTSEGFATPGFGLYPNAGIGLKLFADLPWVKIRYEDFSDPSMPQNVMLEETASFFT